MNLAIDVATFASLGVGDTTPTRKIKRAHFHAMFIDLIEGMYREEAEELNHIAQEAALHQEKGVSYA